MIKYLKNYLQKNIIIIGLIITLTIGIILRFKGLTFQSYWLDELFSVYTSLPSRNFWEMYNITINDVHPPLYQTILWLWYHIFGFTEFSGRSLSAFIGSLSIVALYHLGKVLFNKEVGLYAAIITSTNQFLIYYSQEARSNSLLLLLSSISYIYFLKILNNYNKKDFILYLFFTVALVYTHYFGLFLVATQVFVFIYYFIKDTMNRKSLVIMASITSIILLVSLLPLLDQLISLSEREKIWMKEPTIWFALEYMREYVKSQYLIGIFFMIGVFGAIHLFKKPEHKTYKTATIVLLLWIIMGYLLPYIRSITSAPLLHPRSTIIMIPPLILFLSYSIYLMKDTTLKVVTAGTIMLLSIYHFHYVHYYTKATKEQFRGVLLEVRKSKVKIPAFDIIYSLPNYKTYANMLQLDLNNISNSNELDAKYTQNSLPKCFFVLDAHGNRISKNKILQDEQITKVLEINKRDARGVLYAYNTSSQICSDLYYGSKLDQ